MVSHENWKVMSFINLSYIQTQKINNYQLLWVLYHNIAIHNNNKSCPREIKK